MSQLRKTAIIALLLLPSLVGRGAAAEEEQRGRLARGRLAPPVAGLSYRAGNLRGVTGERGEFEYRPGDAVVLALGPIELGEAPAQPLITLGRLGGEGPGQAARVRTLLRLLLSIDGGYLPGAIDAREAAGVAWLHRRRLAGPGGAPRLDGLDESALAELVHRLQPGAPLLREQAVMARLAGALLAAEAAGLGR
jgi:hypothetical protein